MKDARGRWVGDYWGVVSFGVNTNVVKNVPKSWADLLKPEYANQVALNGSPLSSGSAVAGVFSAALANGGSLSNVGPGIDFFARLKDAGNFVPVQATPQTIASGQTPIVIDWDYLNLAYIKEFPAREDQGLDPVEGRLRRLLRAGDLALRPAPVGGAALAGVRLLGRRPAPVAQGLLASGPLHRHGAAKGGAGSAGQGPAGPGRVREGALREPGAERPGREADREGMAEEGRRVAP